MDKNLEFLYVFLTNLRKKMFKYVFFILCIKIFSDLILTYLSGEE